MQIFEKIKEEFVEPHPETVELLQNLLKRNNQPLHLSFISKTPSEINSNAAEATKPFLEQLEAGNSEAALKELNNLKKGYIRTLSMNSLTDLVDLCLQKNCTHGKCNFNYRKLNPKNHVKTKTVLEIVMKRARQMQSPDPHWLPKYFNW